MNPEYTLKDALTPAESDETARTSCCQTNTEQRRQTCKRVVWSLLHNKNRSVLMEHAHLASDSSKPKEKRLNNLVLYVSMGVILVHSVWATMTAYAYTNLTSIQLLDCLGIPTAMLLSFLILRHQYLWTHYVGAGVCVAGAVMMIGADFLAVEKAGRSNPTNSIKNDAQTNVVIGDILALIGGILYGAYSVLQEYAIHKYGAVNTLANVSMVTSVLCGFYCATMEHEKLTELLTMHTLSGKLVPIKAGICLAGYVCAVFTLDSLMAFTITRVSAVTINLSLLTADVYGLIVGIFVFQLTFHYLYFVAFACIIAGLVCAHKIISAVTSCTHKLLLYGATDVSYFVELSRYCSQKHVLTHTPASEYDKRGQYNTKYAARLSNQFGEW
ncbi:hypothetical protein X801_01119 [Opisthorchis viverrini]|uniref:Solute carrier family 35 member F2 n=1 Tax=Opisthorchis viverrini TaxID=6198 RepID=A0A1S8X898_OPIVI|nr:hypothetical protein X801_01119 [Opisthorchis viverrini]